MNSCVNFWLQSAPALSKLLSLFQYKPPYCCVSNPRHLPRHLPLRQKDRRSIISSTGKDVLCKRTKNTLPVEDIIDLLSFCLNTTYFVFEGCYYQQVFGTAMGSPVSAVIANLVMEDVEQRALASVPVSLSFWKRFVDDVISAVSSNEIDILLQH